MKYMKYIVLSAIASMFFASACVSVTPVYKQNYDFSKIKTVYVAELGGTDAAKAVKNAVIKQVMSKGSEIKSEYDGGTDIVVEGSISKYQPSQTYMVRDYADNTSNTVIYNDSPFEVGGSVYDAGTVFGISDARLFSTTAVVGLSMFMKDPKTNEIVWTSSYTYEGFDLDTSVEGVVKHILKSFPPQFKTGE